MSEHNSSDSTGLELILPPGTQVVSRVDVPRFGGDGICPAGTLGLIAESPLDPTHTYLVRLPDGSELRMRRSQIAIHRQRFEDALASSENPHLSPTSPDSSDEFSSSLDERGLRRHVIFQCVVGSRAYGLETESSDTDRRGIYLPTAEAHWSLWGVPEQLEDNDAQECYWELQKFLTMALKANPNILECLHTPLVEKTTALADELTAMRGVFVTRMIYQTYNGYVLSQFKKLEQDLRTRGEIRRRHAMHLIRLLMSGIGALRTGVVPVRVEAQNRERLLSIKRGEIEWPEIDSWRLALHKEFDEAFADAAGRLPDRPDYHRVNDFLIKARRLALEGSE